MTVYLVGAGPGDPGLITVRGAQLLARADVVVHDRLSARSLLDLAPSDAQRVDVGKRAGQSSTQTDINERLIALGREHRCVVRLKGGDPFVFARGGEEASALEDAGIDYEVVPGVTSAIAAPAAAGIPVTQRYSSTSLTIVTGHEDPTKADSDVAWEKIGSLGGTIVILMGVAEIRSITTRLMAGGLSGDTPTAAIRWGTRPDQSVIRAPLSALADQPLRAPSTIVVGDVAAVDLGWFRRRPLAGRSIVVTRASHQGGQLAGPLRELGADVIEFPVIEIVEPADGGAGLSHAVANIATYEWVVLTSPNGAARFLNEVGDPRKLATTRIAAIGPGTAAALAEARLVADLVPAEFVAESLLAEFPAVTGGGRVLLARAEVARDVLPDGLRAAGWSVDIVDAYRTVAATPDPAALERVASAELVTFTSSSTVQRFVDLVGVGGVPPRIASIGPVTSATARSLGLEPSIEASVHTIAGLVEALRQWSR